MLGLRRSNWTRLSWVLSAAVTLVGRCDGYDYIDPRLHMCEIGVHRAALDGDVLYVHGGYVFNQLRPDQYNLKPGPNNVLRVIDLSKPFKLSDRNAAPVDFRTPPPAVPEISQFSLWAYNGFLYEFSGVTETSDKNYPGWNANSRSEMWGYNIDKNKWAVRKLATPGASKNFEVGMAPYAASVPVLKKAFHLAGVGWEGREGNRWISVFDYTNNTWARYPTDFKRAQFGDFVHVPVGNKGLLVMMAGHKEMMDGKIWNDYQRIDILDLDQGDEKSIGKWLNQPAASAGDYGVPKRRSTTCVWTVSAPDKSSHHIYMYGGYIDDPKASSKGSTAELWVLTLPSFEWILLSNGEGWPKSPQFSQTQPGAREGHSCNLVRKSVMVMFGGRLGPRNPSSWAAHWKERRCETTGLYAFDLNKQEWIHEYDPKKADEEYKVPKAIYEVIGGDENGGATKKEAVRGWRDPSLGETFARKINPELSEPSKTEDEALPNSTLFISNSWTPISDDTVAEKPADPAYTEDSGDELDGSLIGTIPIEDGQNEDGGQSGDGGNKVNRGHSAIGAIIGGAAGGVIGALIIIAAVFIYRRKRQRRRSNFLFHSINEGYSPPRSEPPGCKSPESEEAFHNQNHDSREYYRPRTFQQSSSEEEGYKLNSPFTGTQDSPVYDSERNNYSQDYTYTEGSETGPMSPRQAEPVELDSRGSLKELDATEKPRWGNLKGGVF